MANGMNHNYDTTADYKEKLFHRSESVPHVTQRIVEMLDLIEQRVELLREHASAMETERETLISMLSSIKSNKDLSLASEGKFFFSPANVGECNISLAAKHLQH